MIVVNQINYFDIIKPIWQDEKLYSENSKIYLKRFQSLTEPQKVLFPTHWLYCDIGNGGFHQCFWNGTGMFAPEAVSGFKKLKLMKIADIVQRAIDVFEEPFPREQEDRQDFLDEWQDENEEWNPFVSLDDEYNQSLVLEETILSESDKFWDAANKFAEKYLT